VNILARVISIVFHPLLMATYLLGLLLFFLPAALYPITIASQWSFLLLIFIMTFVLPAINISLLRILGTITSFTMIERHERIRPFFLITIIYCFVTYIFLWKTGISTDDNIFKLLLIIDCLVIAATVITFFYKISVHSIGIMGILGIIIPLNRLAENNALFIPTLAIIVIAGLVMSARLQLNSHSSREVWWGALTGFSLGFLGMMIFF
jgi:hypothetical protein